MVLKSPAGVPGCHVFSLRENATDFGFLILLLQALPENRLCLDVLFLCHMGVLFLCQPGVLHCYLDIL